MPDFREPLGEGRSLIEELLRHYQDLIASGINPFQGGDFNQTQFAGQSRAMPGHSQQWDIRLGTPGLCQINVGHAWLSYPLIEFSANRDTAIIRFTVPAAQFRAPIRTVLRLQEGDIFGDILEWRYHRDNGDVALNVTLRLHLESFQMSAQPGEAVRYRLTVHTARYRRNMTREELLIEEQRHELTYYQRLERAGLLPDRLEGLQELMQEQSVSMPTADDQPVSAEEWHYRQMERAGVFEALRQELGQERSQPPIKQPAICRGCHNLHGQIYNGTMLVCGIHPYGNGENCSDFKGF